MHVNFKLEKEKNNYENICKYKIFSLIAPFDQKKAKLAQLFN